MTVHTCIGIIPSANQTEQSTNITDDLSNSIRSRDTTVIAAVVASVGAVLAITLCVVATVVLVLALKRRQKQEQVVELQGNAVTYSIR